MPKLKLPKPPPRHNVPRPGTTKTNGNGEKPGVKDRAAEAGIATVGWLDERTGTGPFLRGFLYRKVPKGTNWFYTLGSATMFAFLSQAVTGVFLAMYYDPNPTKAYDSVHHITNDVWLGAFVRGMHKWGSTVMVLLVFLHMGRTFFFGAYKYPRELNWLVGFVLLLLTMLMSFTGYLLPFDQRSYWASIVGINLNSSGPIVGPYLADFLRAGSEFSSVTLSRFYAIHMLLIPGAIAALIGAHLYPRREARDDRAAMAQGREGQGTLQGRGLGGADGPANLRHSSSSDFARRCVASVLRPRLARFSGRPRIRLGDADGRPREGAVPPRLLHPEVEGGSRSSPTRSSRTGRWRASSWPSSSLMSIFLGAELGRRLIRPPRLTYLAPSGTSSSSSSCCA